MRIRLQVPLCIKEIANCLNCFIDDTSSRIEYISTDTRELESGDLFFALKGDKYNGEDFVGIAKDKGAFVVSKVGGDISVNDCSDALLFLAQYYKSKYLSIKKTLAITGSVGKTTTKEILKHILSSKFKVHANEKNYNNIIGVSLTVLKAPKDAEILILEMGMNHKGEISRLANSLLPDIAIITNIGYAHIGNFNNRKEIAEAKLEILPQGKQANLIVPYEEELFAHIDNKITVSLENPVAEIYISVIREEKTSCSFDIMSQERYLTCQKISLVGREYISAIAFSIAVCDILKINDNEISNSITKINSSMFRKTEFQIDNYTIIDDTYSSSPDAVINELYTLSITRPSFCCVLGDMLELGSLASSLHKKIGECVYRYNTRFLFAFGRYANDIAVGAINAGMSTKNIHVNSDPEAPEETAYAILKNCLRGEAILFKGSHEAHTERIIEHLQNLLRG